MVTPFLIDLTKLFPVITQLLSFRIETNTLPLNTFFNKFLSHRFTGLTLEQFRTLHFNQDRIPEKPWFQFLFFGLHHWSSSSNRSCSFLAEPTKSHRNVQRGAAVSLAHLTSNPQVAPVPLSKVKWLAKLFLSMAIDIQSTSLIVTDVNSEDTKLERSGLNVKINNVEFPECSGAAKCASGNCLKNLNSSSTTTKMNITRSVDDCFHDRKHVHVVVVLSLSRSCAIFEFRVLFHPLQSAEPRNLRSTHESVLFPSLGLFALRHSHSLTWATTPW